MVKCTLNSLQIRSQTHDETITTKNLIMFSNIVCVKVEYNSFNDVGFWNAGPLSSYLDPEF